MVLASLLLFLTLIFCGVYEGGVTLTVPIFFGVSMFIGFAPFKNPKMTITVTSPDISYEKSSYDYTANTTKRIAKRVSDSYFALYK